MKQLCQLLSVIAITLVSATGCSTFFSREPAQEASVSTKKIHYVLTMHGIRGNKESYGDFHELIKAQLEKIDPTYEVVPVNVIYTVARPDYTVVSAVKEVNEQLDQQIRQLNDNDKISVVAYSMGGQVALGWYFESLKDAAHKKYPEHVTQFVSLDAAFWGAIEAALFTNDLDVLKNLLKAAIVEVFDKPSQDLMAKYVNATLAEKLKAFQDRFNNKYIFTKIDQLKSMDDMKKFYDSVLLKDYFDYDPAGSLLDKNETFRTFRNSSLREIAKVSFAEFQALSIAGHNTTYLRSHMIESRPAHTKWTSISTLFPCIETDKSAQVVGCNDASNSLIKFLRKASTTYSFGFTRRETDNAVITPSSVAQFFYTYAPNENYNAGDVIAAKDFHLSINPINHKSIFAETAHATLVTAAQYDTIFNILGKFGNSYQQLADDVVIVHKSKCTTGVNCDHPVYKYVVDQLADCSAKNNYCNNSVEYKKFVRDFVYRNSTPQKEMAAQNKLKSELHGFTIELNIRLPLDYDASELAKITDGTVLDNTIQMNFAQNDLKDRILKNIDPSSPYKIHIGRRLEAGSILIKKLTYSNQQNLKVNFTGLITTDNEKDYNYQALQNGIVVPFTIQLPGLKSRRVEAVVSPYHSTYVDVRMAR